MTIRQKILKSLYPLLMRLSKKANANKQIIANDPMKDPVVPLFEISFKTIDGNSISMSSFKGKKILIVNTASDCGFTPQYESLEELYKKYSDKLVVLGFPANDFKQQEKRSNDEIMEFCKRNYGVSFPISQKTQVVKGALQHEIYQWLTQSEKNGWNEKQPSWNFSKYLIDENGRLMAYMEPSVDPGTEAFVNFLGI